MQANLAQLPWYHHITLLDKVKEPETRMFYIQKSIVNGWSRNVMVHHIETGLHKRMGNSITNFKQTLPPIQSELAHQTLKNPYLLDFLNLTEDFKEKDLEKALMDGVKNFLLELGNGFAFVGNQKKFRVEKDEFFLDLLFYNYRLHCFVVIELKIGEFKPEFAGKLNFYINVVNEQLKGKEDNQTIGILLCKTPNQTVVRFSLQDIKQPIGVSEYHLQNVLPEKLRGGIPSVEELEEELDREYRELKSPIDLKLEKIKDFLSQKPEDRYLRQVKSNQTVKTVFHSFFEPLTELIFKLMQEKLSTMFIETRIALNVNLHEMDTLTDVELKVVKPLIGGNTVEEINSLGISVKGIGFRAAGAKSFDHCERLTIRLENYAMCVGIREAKNEDIWMEKLYHELPTVTEIQDLSERYLDTWVDGVYNKLSG
ncbi:PDDEXK nuclease domain-containing protein [Algoriphagus sp. D3-2-R+10]|uniref:PDDEXK nuclease domain-containing protein n=1 Tax=Algoriphagus aurantiacus TaxID=3103948 RepID=UPI002B36555B|nr:PDDEXK nuclease domain-containing protein [Algoriphagus sp. D3-2-R+10]MEB2777458.1 PDDEXK nuclease domain-containing protein [Algoriphagus sp. D3-2-R+10]